MVRDHPAISANAEKVILHVLKVAKSKGIKFLRILIYFGNLWQFQNANPFGVSLLFLFLSLWLPELFGF